MYQAELMGKLPSAVEHREDILTSNVFSFFKYTCCEVHLKELFALVGVAASPGNCSFEGRGSEVPLFAINSSDDLMAKVVNPVLKLYREQ